MKRLLALVPVELVWVAIDRLRPGTFGQLGEDAVIDNHLAWLGLPNREKGMYLDIGCFHPTRGSNSARFYRRGASGYVVDFGHRKAILWRLVRRRDTYINAALLPKSMRADVVSVSLSGKYGRATDSVRPDSESLDEGELIKTMQATELSSLVVGDLRWMRAPWRFISIDIEGMDEEVLRELDLANLAPDVIAIEHFLPSGSDPFAKFSILVAEPLVLHLRDEGFSLQSVCGPTLIFVRKASMRN